MDPDTQSSQKKNMPKILFTLIIVALFIAVALGIYFWKASDKNKPVVKNDGSSISIPSDWNEYKATKYGFMFNYPKSWGTPIVNDYSKKNGTKLEIVIPASQASNYSVVATIQKDNNDSSTITRANIKRVLQGNKKGLLNYDDNSYSIALQDPETRALAQVNLYRVVNLNKIGASALVAESLLNPGKGCPGDKLATNGSKDCFTEKDYNDLSTFAFSFKDLQ